jgi:hypothetical protein
VFFRKYIALMHAQWIVEKDPNGDWYTFKNSRVADRFLALQPGAAPGNGAALSGRVLTDAALFTIRKVPGSQKFRCEVSLTICVIVSSADSYDARIFYAPQNATNYNARALAVNLNNATPKAANLRTHTAEAPTQTWSFI